MIAAGKVVEPLAELYKVEVRELGEQLGIPRELLWRHPFPGPGLGVRLLCSTGVEDREGFAEVEPAAARVAGDYGLEALVLPIRSVGVKADLRSYEHPVLLHGAVGWDRVLEAAGMIFQSGAGHQPLRLEPRARAAARTPGRCAATVTRDRLDLLREADAIVMDGLRRHGLYDRHLAVPDGAGAAGSSTARGASSSSSGRSTRSAP